MKKKIFISVLLCFLFIARCFSQEIVLGKIYKSKDLDILKTELIKIYEINIRNKNIIFYGEKKDNNHFYNEKLLVIKNHKDKILYSEGIYLTDQDSLYSFYSDEKNCAFKLKNIKDRNNPSNEIWVISSNKNNVLKKTIPENFIASLVVLKQNVFYTTEFSDSNLKKLDLDTMQITGIPISTPNARLININDTVVLGETIDSKFFYIKDNNEVIFLYDEIKNKELGIIKYKN